MNHLLTSSDDLQEIPSGNTDFSWFTNCLYLRSDSGKCGAGYAFTTPFDVVEAASLLVATLA